MKFDQLLDGRFDGEQPQIGQKRAAILPPSTGIFNIDTDDSLVEPAYQSPYNARALNEEETRAAIG